MAGSNDAAGAAASEGAATSIGEAAATADAAATAPAADRQAEELLKRSIAALEGCSSISAKTRQSVELYGKRLAGSGEYLELRATPIPMFRLELKVQVGDEPKTLLHVCDGRHFWRCETFKGKGSAERIDLARAVQAREALGDAKPPAVLGPWPGVGGLPKLLRELQGAFLFSAPRPTTLPDQDRTPVLALTGVWRPERLAALLPASRPGSKPAAAGPDGLPEHLPYSVIVFLGRDDLFPFRIEYHRLAPTGSGPQPSGEDPPMVAMDFYLVTLNAPIHRKRFSFDPGKLEWSDETDRYLDRLGLNKK